MINGDCIINILSQNSLSVKDSAINNYTKTTGSKKDYIRQRKTYGHIKYDKFWLISMFPWIPNK